MKLFQSAFNLIAAAGIFGLALIVGISVFFRYVLGQPIAMTEDLMTILLGVTIFTAFPLVSARREHVAVDVLNGLFSRAPRLDRLRRGMIDIATIALLGIMALRLWEQASRYRMRGNFTATMQWHLWPAVTLFAALASLAALLLTLRVLHEGYQAWRQRRDSAIDHGMTP